MTEQTEQMLDVMEECERAKTPELPCNELEGAKTSQSITGTSKTSVRVTSERGAGIL